MIKVKVNDIANSIPVVNDMMVTKLSIGLSYKLKKIADESNTVLNEFNDKRTAILEKHGKLSEDGKQYEFENDEARASYETELRDVLEEDIDLDVVKISLEALEKTDIDIEPSRIGLIEWFIDA